MRAVGSADNLRMRFHVYLPIGRPTSNIVVPRLLGKFTYLQVTLFVWYVTIAA